MTDVLNALLDATAEFVEGDADDEAIKLQESRALHLQTIEALCVLERDFPKTELSIFVHEILHVPEFIYRWNSVRNYWCFATERYVGWMKRFVKNRSLSVENMVHSQYVNNYDSTFLYMLTEHIYYVCACAIGKLPIPMFPCDTLPPVAVSGPRLLPRRCRAQRRRGNTLKALRPSEHKRHGRPAVLFGPAEETRLHFEGLR